MPSSLKRVSSPPESAWGQLDFLFLLRSPSYPTDTLIRYIMLNDFSFQGHLVNPEQVLSLSTSGPSLLLPRVHGIGRVLPLLTAHTTVCSFLGVTMKSLSRVRDFVTAWTVAYRAPPSMGFSRQEHWGGLPFPSPGELPDPRIKPGSPAL